MAEENVTYVLIHSNEYDCLDCKVIHNYRKDDLYHAFHKGHLNKRWIIIPISGDTEEERAEQVRQLLAEKPMIKAGIWKHWKGGQYEVFTQAINRDTGKIIVMYRKQYGDEGDRVWEWKPLEEFVEQIDKDGYKGPRYWLIMSNQEGPK